MNLNLGYLLILFTHWQFECWNIFHVHFRIAKKSQLFSVVVGIVVVDVVIVVDRVDANLFFSWFSRSLVRVRWYKSELGWYPFTIAMAKSTIIRQIMFSFFVTNILTRCSEEYWRRVHGYNYLIYHWDCSNFSVMYVLILLRSVTVQTSKVQKPKNLSKLVLEHIMCVFII